MEELIEGVSGLGLIASAVLGVALAIGAHGLAETIDWLHEKLSKVAVFLMVGAATVPTVVTPPLTCSNNAVVSGDGQLHIEPHCVGGLPIPSEPPGLLHGYLIPMTIDLVKEGVVVGIFFVVVWSIVRLIRRASVSKARGAA